MTNVGTDIKLSFIHRCVKQYVEDVVVAMDRTIRKNGVIQSGALQRSLSEAADENVGKLIFLEYGRFVDMGVGRGKRLADVAADTSKLGKKSPQAKEDLLTHRLRQTQRPHGRSDVRTHRRNHCSN